MENLEGKVAVVTGAASGIGRALVDRLGADGMRVVLADIEEEALDAAAADAAAAGIEAVAVPTDVSSASSVEELAERAVQQFGSVHVVCNNAGVAPTGPVLESTPADWAWVVGVNLMGVVHGVLAFGPALVSQGEGHIVNTASGAGLMPTPSLGPYCATKHAVVGLSETLYHELAGTGVGVSVVCPGFVKTKIFHSERNRPEDLGGEMDYTDERRAMQAVVDDAGTEPSLVADRAVEAIGSGELFVLPHPELVPVVRQRIESITGSHDPTSPYENLADPR